MSSSIKMPENETYFHRFDTWRSIIDSSLSDDKALLKADGVHITPRWSADDYSMKITHAFRGEEWLLPAHLLLWKYYRLGMDMPQWGTPPLILKTLTWTWQATKGMETFRISVFAMNWTDPKPGELINDFVEIGFYGSFYKPLAVLSWNDGTEQEIFSKKN